MRQALGDPAGADALNLVSCLLKGRADPNTSELLNQETRANNNNNTNNNTNNNSVLYCE